MSARPSLRRGFDGPGVDAYGKSKTLAERAAWDFIATEGPPMELATLLPVAVMGP